MYEFKRSIVIKLGLTDPIFKKKTGFNKNNGGILYVNSLYRTDDVKLNGKMEISCDTFHL